MTNTSVMSMEVRVFGMHLLRPGQTQAYTDMPLRSRSQKKKKELRRVEAQTIFIVNISSLDLLLIAP
jgi:hypothetical protein